MKRLFMLSAVAMIALQAGIAGAQQFGQPPQGGPPPGQPPQAGRPAPQGQPPQQAPDRNADHRRKDNVGRDAAILGLGIVSGFAVGNVLDNHGTIPTVRYPGPPPEPVEPREPRPPRYPPPPPPPGGWDRRGDDRWGPPPPPPPPWSPGWYRWCSDNYPSFDPRDGTVRTRDGFRRMCFVH